MRSIVAALLMLDGLLGALWVARFVPVFGAYDGVVIALILLRGCVAALLCTSAWLLMSERPPASIFATTAVVASAIFVTLEIGFRVSPSSLFPTYRWPFVSIYWCYALGVAMYVNRSAER